MIEKIILIPDVHGREFWKAPVMEYKDKPGVQIVFLGDYLDPYPHEGITPEQSITGFLEILEVARESKNITLLLGNHDLHYLPHFHREYGCRRINSRLEELGKLFTDNMDLFSVAWDIEIQGKTYLMTHAGIIDEWFEWITGQCVQFRGETYASFMGLSPEDAERLKIPLTSEGLNSLISFPAGLDVLWMVSYERGGGFPWGSCMWADIHEHLYRKNNLPDVYQIFSHTLTYPDLDSEYIDSKLAMLDCGRAFVLSALDGKIQRL